MREAQSAIGGAAGVGTLARHFIEAHRHLRPRSPIPPIQAEFFPFAGLNHSIRRRSGRISARVSDILSDAPAEVVGAVAAILLGRLYRQRVDPDFSARYRRYILSDTIRQRAEAARRERGRVPADPSRGRYVNLDQTFDRLNREWFDGKLPKPALYWSHLPSRRRLGRYDAARRAITISRIFDAPFIPSHVTDYILFHEMLHMQFLSLPGRSHRVVHSVEFRAAERAFPSFAEAHAWLDRTLGADSTNTALENAPAVVQSDPLRE